MAKIPIRFFFRSFILSPQTPAARSLLTQNPKIGVSRRVALRQRTSRCQVYTFATSYSMKNCGKCVPLLIPSNATRTPPSREDILWDILMMIISELAIFMANLVKRGRHYVIRPTMSLTKLCANKHWTRTKGEIIVCGLCQRIIPAIRRTGAWVRQADNATRWARTGS